MKNPVDLVKSPVMVSWIEVGYSHSTQTRFSAQQDIFGESITAHGTATYDYQGKPVDNDNDN
jgi:hypothetical protein